MVLRSQQFDDVYFSVDDGMAETQYVFLDGNNLPQGWMGKESFTIAETGFGTGLNFLCAWKLFEETAAPHQKLHFISFEKYPLSKDQIKEALMPWAEVLGDYIDRYLDVYPIRVPGPHHIYISDRVSLTLWIGDVHDVMAEWQGDVDAWFLDGFTPSKNPDMWSEEMFAHMARLSHANTTYATFTAAGFVRRGLEAVGFSVEKCKGFGRKRDMIKGRFIEEKKTIQGADVRKIAIIGGGLAGCAMAYFAMKRGIAVSIYEAGDSLASGASAGRLGMVNPKLTAKPSPHANYYTSAYANALRVLPIFEDVDFISNGSIHLCVDADKDRRFTGYIDNLGWHEDHIQRLDNGDLFYPDGASVCPQKLCHEMAKGADIHLNHNVETLDDIDADVIVIANGHAVNDLIDGELPVNWVRGQVSWIKPQDDVKTNMSYGGYITPETSDGFHVLGSTLDPKNKDLSLLDEDHLEVLRRYNGRRDKNLSMDDVVGGWAALRSSSKDRFPIVGRVSDNIYVSTAHGSHGIISSLYAAQIMMADIIGEHMPVSGKVMKALSPSRFNK